MVRKTVGGKSRPRPQKRFTGKIVGHGGERDAALNPVPGSDYLLVEITDGIKATVGRTVKVAMGDLDRLTLLAIKTIVNDELSRLMIDDASDKRS